MPTMTDEEQKAARRRFVWEASDLVLVKRGDGKPLEPTSMTPDQASQLGPQAAPLPDVNDLVDRMRNATADDAQALLDEAERFLAESESVVDKARIRAEIAAVAQLLEGAPNA